MKTITPLVNTTVPHVLTSSVLEQSETIGDREFGENFEQGRFHPVSQDGSGQGETSMEPTYYDRRNGMKGSFLVKETK